MPNRPPVISPNAWIVVVLLATVAVAGVAVLRIDRTGRRGSGLRDEFDYQIDKYKKIAPEAFGYEQTLEFPCYMKTVRAVAVGPEDRIHVVGDSALRAFEPGGKRVLNVALESEPSCVAVGDPMHQFPGRIYVGTHTGITQFDADGTPRGQWQDGLSEKSVLTSIAVAEQDIFVADAGQSAVLRYNTSGELIGRIGDLVEKPDGPAFAIPSPFFDVVIDPIGWIRVVNPGALRIEAFSYDGKPQIAWGTASARLEGFFGCCNPANLALLPDGRFVTAEKGLLRVKVYSSNGKYECVVAGPEQLEAPSLLTDGNLSDREYAAVDVAADSRGRVLILDLAAGTVRVFEPKQEEAL